MFVSENSELAPWRSINSTFWGIGAYELWVQTKVSTTPIDFWSYAEMRCIRYAPCTKSLNEGDSVEMLTGPFANFIASVDTIDPEQRIWVLMDFMDQKHVCRSLQINCNSLNRFLLNFRAFSIHWDLFGRPNECLNIRFLCKHIRSASRNYFLNLHWRLTDAHSPIGILLRCG